MVQDYHFNMASVSENSILTILKPTQVSKAAGLDSLSGRFLKDGAKFLAKPISDLYNLSINSEKFPHICKVAKLKPPYKKGSLTQPCNYKPMSLLPLIFKVIKKVVQDQTSTFSEIQKFIMLLPIWFSEKPFYRFLPFSFE